MAGRTLCVWNCTEKGPSSLDIRAVFGRFAHWELAHLSLPGTLLLSFRPPILLLPCPFHKRRYAECRWLETRARDKNRTTPPIFITKADCPNYDSNDPLVGAEVCGYPSRRFFCEDSGFGRMLFQSTLICRRTL